MDRLNEKMFNKISFFVKPKYSSYTRNENKYMIHISPTIEYLNL